MLNRAFSFFSSTESLPLKEEFNNLKSMESSLDEAGFKMKLSPEIDFKSLISSDFHSSTKNLFSGPRATFVFKDDVRLGSGIISVPLLTNLDGCAVVFTKFGLKSFQVEFQTSRDDLMRASDALQQYLISIKKLLVLENICAEDESVHSFGNYADDIMSMAYFINTLPEYEALVESITCYHLAFKNTLVNQVSADLFSSTQDKLFNTQASLIFKIPDINDSLFLKELGLIGIYSSTDDSNSLEKPKFVKCSSIEKLQSERRFIINEFIEKERRFFKNIQVLDTHYNQPILKSWQDIHIPSFHFAKSIAVPVTELIKISGDLLKDLENDNSLLNVCQIFIKYSQVMEIPFQTYITDITYSNGFLVNNPQLKGFTEKTRNEIETGDSPTTSSFAFSDLRELPARQLIAYPQFFRRLLETIDPSHQEEYGTCSSAWSIAKELGKSSNKPGKDRLGNGMEEINLRLANKIKSFMGHFITDLTIKKVDSKKPTKAILYTKKLVFLDANMVMETQFNLESLTLACLKDSIYIANDYKFTIIDSEDRQKAFFKLLEYYLTLETKFKNCNPNQILYESLDQVHFYLREITDLSTLMDSSKSDFKSGTCASDVALVLLHDDGPLRQDVLDTIVKLYKFVFIAQRGSLGNYAIIYRSKYPLKYTDDATGLKPLSEASLKSQILASLKNVAFAKLDSELLYSKSDLKLLNGHVTHLAMEFFKEKTLKSHERGPTKSSIASSFTSLVEYSKQVGRKMSILKKGYTDSIKTNNTGFDSLGGTMRSPPVRGMRDMGKNVGTRLLKKLGMKKTSSSEKLTCSFMDITSSLLTYVLSLQSDSPNLKTGFKKVLVDALMSHKRVTWSQYTVDDLLEAYRDYNLAYNQVLLSSYDKQMIFVSTGDCDPDQEIVPKLEYYFRKRKDLNNLACYFELFNRLNMKSQEEWFPVKDILDYYSCILHFSSPSKETPLAVFDRTVAKHALECLMFNTETIFKPTSSLQSLERQFNDASSIQKDDKFQIQSLEAASRVPLAPVFLSKVEPIVIGHHIVANSIKVSESVECSESKIKTVTESKQWSFSDLYLAQTNPKFMVNVYDPSGEKLETLLINTMDEQEVLNQSIKVVEKTPLVADGTLTSLVDSIGEVSLEKVVRKPFKMGDLVDDTMLSMNDLDLETHITELGQTLALDDFSDL